MPNTVRAFCRRYWRWLALPLGLVLGEDDSDMKIASDSPGEKGERADVDADEFADAYLIQNGLGNIARARELGALFAERMLRFAAKEEGPPKGPARAALLAFGVNRAVELYSPNSILAQTALSAFYEAVSRMDDVSRLAVNDATSLSFYLLAARSAEDEPRAVGQTFARLSQSHDPQVSAQAGALYRSFLQELEEATLGAGYARYHEGKQRK